MSSNTTRREFFNWTLGAAAAVPAASLLLGADKAAADRIDVNFIRRVAEVAKNSVGQSFGRGECTDFVDAVLARLHGKPGRNYVWGLGSSTPSVGLIVQFFGTRFTSPDGHSWWGTSTQHTAIIVGSEVQNGRPTSRLTLAEQNVNGVRSVRLNTYDLSWPHTGQFHYYIPLKAS